MGDGSNGSGGIGVRTQAGLHQLVGYAELIKAAGVSRSTIERAWRGPWDDGEPHLPKPGKIGSRSVWAAEDANTWLLARARWQCGMLTALARFDVNSLSPDELGDAAIDLLMRAIENEIGEPVDAAGIRITYGPPQQVISEADFAMAEAAEAAMFKERFSGFDTPRACVMAAWLFPELRPIFAEAAIDDGIRRTFLDEEALRALALSAMNDHHWERGLAAFKAMSTKGRT